MNLKGARRNIDDVLHGRHTLGILPTGSGKMLSTPTYILEKPTLIISPLISLMDDQVMQMKLKVKHMLHVYIPAWTK